MHKFNSERRFAEVLVSIVQDNGSTRMARALLDSGCSRSIILKEFTRSKRQIELDAENQKVYRTYGGKFISKSKASVGLRMVEFERNSNITIEHEFQVDEEHKSKKSKYDLIIGSDLMWNMGVNICYSKEQVH